MKAISMSGSLRENVGKKAARQSRREGLVPSVLYGGKDQIHFCLDEKSLKKVIYTPDVYLINFDIAGTKKQAVIQDLQVHPTTDKVLHIDFLEITPGKPVIMNLPIRLEGVALGVLAGGKLVKKFRTLKVKGLVENMPEEIKVNVTKLEIGGTVKVSSLTSDTLQFLDRPTGIVATVKSTRAAATAEEAVPGKK
ncbi:MAG: 50S ribosomal protein L25/general stress protein Ctc [Bacteroidales bacterium]|jgi:large subunit ribosomal protein L25|nr:50S ribosomal protein L25/general stress protein Ctc [Bacteroidales bacterium]